MENKEEIKEFQNYLIQEAQANNKDPEKYVQELGEEGLKEAYKRFQTYKQKKAKKAAHGAKLDYIKRLKDQCAEDEELVYFKRGGAIGCGCVKKKQEGGGITKKALSAIDNFKARINQKRKEVEAQRPDKNGEYTTKDGIRVITRKGTNERQRTLDANKTKEETTPPKINKGVGKNEKGSKLKKNCGGAQIKIKSHKQGGSLNGIPFIKRVQLRED